MVIESRPLCPKADERGDLLEIFKGSLLGRKDWGQIYLFSLKPGFTRGNHYHQSKNEWFLVLDGQVEILLEEIQTKERISLIMNGAYPELLPVPAGFVHSFRNPGQTTAKVLAYIDQEFNPEAPDTYPFQLV